MEPRAEADKRPPEFDSSEPVRTLKWLKQATEPMRKAGNAIAFKNEEEKLALVLNSLQGKNIDWLVKIEAITEDGLQLATISEPHSYDETVKAIVNPKVTLQAGMLPATFINLGLFKVEKSEWVFSLKPGHTVRLQGVIKTITCKPENHNKGNIYRLVFAIENYKVSKP